MWEDGAVPDPMWQDQSNGVGPFDGAIFDTDIFDSEPETWIGSGVPGDAWS